MKVSRSRRLANVDKKGTNNKIIIPVILAIGLIFATIMTLLYGFHWNVSSETQMIETNSIKEIKDEDGTVNKYELTFPKGTYVQYLNFQLHSKSNTSDVGYKVFLNDETLNKTFSYNYETHINRTYTIPQMYLGVEKSIPVKQKVSKITVEMFNTTVEGENSLSGFAVDNSFYFITPLWFALFIASVILLFFFVKLAGKISITFDLLTLLFVAASGMFVAFYQPAHHSYDEGSHFTRSYGVASGFWLFENDSEYEYPKEILKVDFKNHLSYNSYPEYLRVKDQFNEWSINDTVKQEVHTAQAVYTFVPYLFSGAGVFIAKFFGTSLITAVHFARLGNLIFYVICCCLAIRWLPVKKRLLRTFFSLSPLLFIAVSLTADLAIIGFLLAVFSYLLKVKKEQIRLTWPSYLLIVFVFILIGLSKSPYSFLILMILILDKENLPDRMNPKINMLIAFTLGLIVFIFCYWYGNHYGGTLTQWNKPGIDSGEQIKYVLTHPFDYVLILWRQLGEVAQGTLQFFNAYVYNGKTSGVFSLAAFTMLILLIFGQTKNEESFLLMKDKLITAASMIISFVLSATALYVTFTAVGNDQISGYQWRYFIPMLIIGTALFHTDKIKINIKPKFLDFILFTISYLNLINFVFMFTGNFYR